MNSATFAYAILSILTAVFLLFLGWKLLASTLDIRKEIAFPVIAGAFTILFYVTFLFSSYYKSALIFQSLFFAGTDWLAYSMLFFSLAYTSSNKKHTFIRLFFFILISIDSISLIANTWFFHSFDLIQLFNSSGFSWWGSQFTWIHYVHLYLCYIMVASTFIILLTATIKAPSFYKIKYGTVLAAYFFVILANYVSYTLNTPVDFSIVLYGVLAAFICYFATKRFPAYLVNQTLITLSKSISDIIFCFDYKGKLIEQNKAAFSFLQIIFEGDIKKLEEYRNEFLKSKPASITFQLQDQTRHYKTEYQELFIKGSYIGSYLKLEDKTNEITQLEKRRYEATHDSLTGLLNRYGLFEEIKKALADNRFESPLMLCSNIKNFRMINEIYGEKFGDKVLIEQAAMMTKLAHKKNINGRLCDDKFAIFMEKEDFDPSVFEESYHLLSSLTDASVYQMNIDGGIYQILDKTENVQTMYDKAKIAMDSLANDYQNMFATYDSTMMDKLLAEKNVVSQFESALETLQFEVYYQPVCDEQDNCIMAEALVRWHLPHQGVIYPDSFIPILENTGLIYQLDTYVWETVAKKIKEWKNKGYKNVTVSVNVSSNDRFFINLEKTLSEIVAKYGISPENICLEFREMAFTDKTESFVPVFNKIKNAGFKVILDSFGSGYSSMNLLKDFEVYGIKVDRSFLDEDQVTEKGRTILQTIVELSSQLNMYVITKRVETKSHIKIFSDMGCNLFQGHYYSKPLSAKDFEDTYLK